MGVILTSCFAVLLLSATCYGQREACDIPSVEIGQNTTLTCYYNEDVWRLQRKIIIIHYHASFNEKPETVLFSSTFNGVLDYYTHPEYVLRNTKDIIQVEIPRVAKKHAGRYVCLVVQSNIFEECSLTAQEPLDLRYDTVSTTHYDITRTHKSGSTDQKHPMTIIIGVIAGSMIVIILLVTAVGYRLKRSRCSLNDVEETNHEKCNTMMQGNNIQYSQVNEQDKSRHDKGFGSTNNVHADIMHTCLEDDPIKQTEEELTLCQNVLSDKEIKKIYEKGKENHHKSLTGNVAIAEDAVNKSVLYHVVSDYSSSSQTDDFSDSSYSGI